MRSGVSSVFVAQIHVRVVVVLEHGLDGVMASQ